MAKTTSKNKWITSGNPDKIEPKNDGWREINKSGYNNEVLTGNSLIDNAGIW